MDELSKADEKRVQYVYLWDGPSAAAWENAAIRLRRWRERHPDDDRGDYDLVMDDRVL